MYLLSTHTTYNLSSEAADLIRFRYHRYLPLVAILNVVLKIVDSKNMLVVDTLCSSIVSLVNNLCWGDSWQLDSSQLSDSQNRSSLPSPGYSQLNPRYTHFAFIVSHCLFFIFSFLDWILDRSVRGIATSQQAAQLRSGAAHLPRNKSNASIQTL